MQISSSKIDQIHKIFHAKEYYDFRMKKIKRKKKIIIENLINISIHNN